MIRFFERNTLITWLFVFIIALCMFLLSSRQFTGITTNVSFFSVLYHLLAYFLLCTFLLFAVVKGKHIHKMIPVVLAVVIYGISDEVHQLFVPGRHFSVGDIFIDMVGASIASLLYALVLILRKK